jgi:hypothetical protein
MEEGHDRWDGAPAKERRLSVGINQAKLARRETGAMPDADRPARRPDAAGGTPALPETHPPPCLRD